MKLLFLLVSSLVFANVGTYQKFEFSPELSDVSVKKGKNKVEISITVSNPTDSVLDLVPIVSEFVPNAYKKENVYPYNIHKKVSLSESSFKLSPKEKREIKFYYNVEKGRKGFVFFRYEFEVNKKIVNSISSKLAQSGDVKSDVNIIIKKVGRGSIDLGGGVFKSEIKVNDSGNKSSISFDVSNLGNTMERNLNIEGILLNKGSFVSKVTCLINGTTHHNFYPETKTKGSCFLKEVKKGSKLILIYKKEGNIIMKKELLL